jgi:hypothetical protein
VFNKQLKLVLVQHLRLVVAVARNEREKHPMGKFDTGQGNGRTPEGLEASHHRGASAFDHSMILLNDIIEVRVTSHLNILPLRILLSQKPKRQVPLQVAIERDLARPPRQTRR